MPKKRGKTAKKKTIRKAGSKISATKIKRIDDKIEHIERLNTVLIDNFVSLQKVMTNLATKFDSLSEQISKLLQLFEISAKSFLEKQEKGGTEIQRDTQFLNKLNTLLEQNKTIAKGLTLLGEDMREKIYGNAGQNKKEFRRLPRY